MDLYEFLGKTVRGYRGYVEKIEQAMAHSLEEPSRPKGKE